MNLKNTIFILVIVVFLLQMMVLKQDASLALTEKKEEEKMSIMLSTFPLYDIAKNIAQDKITTQMILPAGVDIHSYEPNPKQIVKLYTSNLVVYSGASLEPWIAKLKFENKSIDMSKHVQLIELDERDHDAQEHHHADAHTDPHYWLSIKNMQRATQVITKAIIELDDENKDFYTKNADEYIQKLDALDEEYAKGLSQCAQHEILTNHNAFAYLAQAYNFEVRSLSTLSPDAQSNAKKMITLIQEIRKNKITTLFSESFTSARAIQTIANEAGIKVEVLQPLANITKAQKHLSYGDIMRENLAKLREAMECR